MDPNGSVDIGLAIRFEVSQKGTKKNAASFWSDMLKHKVGMNILEGVYLQTLKRIIIIQETKIDFRGVYVFSCLRQHRRGDVQADDFIEIRAKRFRHTADAAPKVKSNAFWIERNGQSFEIRFDLVEVICPGLEKFIDISTTSESL